MSKVSAVVKEAVQPSKVHVQPTILSDAPVQTVDEALEKAETTLQITEAKVSAVKASKYDSTVSLTEAEAASSEAYRIVKPLIEMKRREIVKEQELQTHLDSLMQSIEDNTRELSTVKTELTELRSLHSLNAEKESRVLDKLLEVL
jgi:dynactin complex subunit